jgi:glycosyltransferase involved in cell wall biosynthesis
LLEVNALLSDEARAFRALCDYQTARAAEDEALLATDRVFCVSAQLAEAVAQRGVDPARIEVMPNGFDSRLFRPRQAVRLRRQLGIHSRFVVGMVGSLKPWHGVCVLLEAFRLFAARHSNAALLIVGDGPERVSVEEFRARHPGLAVVAPGAVPHDDVPAMVAACDVATAPYDANDAFYFSPMKLYEYLAVGRPVVASAQGQIMEVIEDGVNGLLVPPGDPVALSAALGRLARSPALRARLGYRGRETVAGRTWEANARRILHVVGEVSR